jgi:hypothetical protein
MKSHFHLLLPLGAMISASALSAQVYTTNFAGGYDPLVFAEFNASGPSFDLKNPDTFSGDDFLNYYTTTAPTGFERVFLNYQGAAPLTPTNLQDFSLSIDVSNFAASQATTVGDLAQIGFNINNAANLATGFSLYNGAYFFPGFGGSSDAIFFDGINFAQPSDFSPSMTLGVTFSAATQTFTFSRASSATSAAFVPFATLNIDNTAIASTTDFVADWAMAPGDFFDINIFAGSNIPLPDQLAGNGFMNADNFFIDVVPEPSAYGLLFGLAAVGFLALRRRHHC